MSSPKPPPGPPPVPLPPTVDPYDGIGPLVGPDRTARDRGLEQFGDFVAALLFSRTMAPNQSPQRFTVPRDHYFVEMPDNVQDLPFPSICVLPGRGEYIGRGLGGADPIEDPVTDGSPRPAYIVPFDYVETVGIQAWGSKIAERRAVLAGLEAVFGAFDGTSDVRLLLPDYFGLAATFSLLEAELIDDIESARGRRRGTMYLEMTVPVARAVLLPEFRPYVTGLGPSGVTVVDSIAALSLVTGEFGVPVGPHGELLSVDPYLYPQPPSYPLPGPMARGRFRRPT